MPPDWPDGLRRGKRRDGVVMRYLRHGHRHRHLRRRQPAANTDWPLPLRGRDAERAAARIREEQKLSQNNGSVEEYLHLLEFFFSPDLIIGGGVSKKQHKFLPHLSTRRDRPAQLLNEAGIIGAAMSAIELAAPD